MDRDRLCKQCMYYEENENGCSACWAPEENWEKAKGQPNTRICGYKNIKFGEKCYTRQQEYNYDRQGMQ